MKKTTLLTTILLLHTTIISADTQLTLSPSLLHFDYTEFDTSEQVFNRELGWLPGLESDLNHTFSSGWSINIFGAYYQGAVDYTGQLQSGAPLSTNTGTKLFRFGGRVTKNIYGKLYLFAGAQQHRWNRSIKGTDTSINLDEIYKWLEYSIGLNSTFHINNKNSINIDIAYLLIRNATINIDLSEVNAGDVNLDIADGTGGRLNLSWKTIYTDNTFVGLSFFFEAWDFGRSNTKPTQGGALQIFVTEPRSETRNAGLKLNIEYMF